MQERSYPPKDPTAAFSAGLRFPTPGLRDLPGRPECHPTIYWSVRHALEPIEEDMVTGLGAPTEVPDQDWCEA